MQILKKEYGYHDGEIVYRSGCMGVPITFMSQYNPDQFEIIRFRKGDDDQDLAINGKPTYFRIIIRRRQKEGAQ